MTLLTGAWGYTRGVLVSVLSPAGFAVGAVAGGHAAPLLLADGSSSPGELHGGCRISGGRPAVSLGPHLAVDDRQAMSNLISGPASMIAAAAVAVLSAAVLATVRDGWLDVADGVVLVASLAVLARSAIRWASDPDAAHREGPSP